MKQTLQIGHIRWSPDDIRAAIPEFLRLYNARPIRNNFGGMRSPHMLATWFMLKQLNPAHVIESGVWKGQGTWLLENTLPRAGIYSIDPNLKLREYRSGRAAYFDKDFTQIDWSLIPDKENTVLFFDDHQNAFERLKQGMEWGFKKFIFEDNYPKDRGDCYSLKKAFQHAGHIFPEKEGRLVALFNRFINRRRPPAIAPNGRDAGFLKDALAVYYEFPPVFKPEKTRWGDSWADPNYPTAEPLYRVKECDTLDILEEEARDYTWICLAIVK